MRAIVPPSAQTEVFKMDSFYVTDVDKTPLAVAYMGRLRKGSAEAFKDADKRLQAIEGACVCVCVRACVNVLCVCGGCVVVVVI
jgi:hypothetical protein